MKLIQQFDANNFDPTQGTGSLPVGKHPVIVDSSEVKPNKENTGGYLQLNLKIIDGPQTGTIGAYRLNLYHSSQQTVEIAHKQLSAICHVTGQFRIEDSAQLHNIPFIVEVAPQKNDPQYTEVKRVYDIQGNEPGKKGPSAAQAPAPAQHAAPAWGAPAQQAPAAPAQAAAPAWGQPAQQQAAPAQAAPAAWAAPQQQQPSPTQQAAPAGWQPGGAAPQGNTPPWGAR